MRKIIINSYFLFFFGLVFKVCTFLFSILILIYLWGWCKWYDRWWTGRTLSSFCVLWFFWKKLVWYLQLTQIYYSSTGSCHKSFTSIWITEWIFKKCLLYSTSDLVILYLSCLIRKKYSIFSKKGSFYSSFSWQS